MQKFTIPFSILFSAILIFSATAYKSGSEVKREISWPEWENIGKRLVDSGVIDAEKFEALYVRRGGLSDEEKKLLYGENNGKLVINDDNANFVLNLLWAFGLANKNPILEEGPMTDPSFGGAGGFASTGGWTLAKGDAMEHYSKHSFVVLTEEQQKLVEEVSQNIYRPCCNNSTYFPDCNHGMATLGLLELLAAQGASEQDLYRTALEANSLWFPDTYYTITEYLKSKNINPESVEPKKILSKEFSSYSGISRVIEEFTPPDKPGGASCGV